MMFRHKLLFLGFILILIGFAVRGGIAQSTPKVTPRSPDALRNIFAYGLLGQDKPGGSVIVKNNCGAEKPHDLLKQPLGASEDPFDFIIKTNPDYRIVKGPELLHHRQ